MFETKVVKKISTRILCSFFFVVESRAVYGIMWKYLIETHRLEMPHTHTHTHKIHIRPPYYFASATLATQTHLNITLISTLPVLCS